MIMCIIQIAELGCKEIFGEIECFSNENRQTEAISLVNSTVIFVIRHEEFLKKIVDNNSGIKNLIEKYLDEKIKWRT